MSIASLNAIGISAKEWFKIIGKELNIAIKDKIKIMKYKHPEATLNLKDLNRCISYGGNGFAKLKTIEDNIYHGDKAWYGLHNYVRELYYTYDIAEKDWEIIGRLLRRIDEEYRERQEKGLKKMEELVFVLDKIYQIKSNKKTLLF